jgi:DNA-directed RNA polymerase specialized sigma24 family protein
MKRALEIDAFDSTSHLHGDPIDQIARSQQSLLLREAMHGLAEGEAAILKGWVDGASTAELAERLGISAAATRTRLSRAKANLVRALRGHFDERSKQRTKTDEGLPDARR